MVFSRSPARAKHVIRDLVPQATWNPDDPHQVRGHPGYGGSLSTEPAHGPVIARRESETNWRAHMTASAAAVLTMKTAGLMNQPR